uniref:Uncharacterized protein n=1 Tax=Hordeum vulgare subsp. vulgare TaxID=112509 RepID=M0XT86_HORVV
MFLLTPGFRMLYFRFDVFRPLANIFELTVHRAESQSLHSWSAKYCPLMPPSRSTIAVAFSLDGRTLASTQ